MKERSGMPYDVVAYEADELARLLDPWEEGVFHRMLRLAWMNGSVPADINELAELCRVRPSSLQKAWPKLGKMWHPVDGNPSRLRNKKQEIEKVFLESKREAARIAGKLSAKIQKDKKNISTTVERPLNDRSTSLPIPFVPSEQENKEEEECARVTPQVLFDTYNRERGGLLECRKLTAERRRKCNARITESANPVEFLSSFTESVCRARASPFMTGAGDRQWVADFDFLIANDKNYIRVLEGRYDGQRQSKTDQRTNGNNRVIQDYLSGGDEADGGNVPYARGRATQHRKS